MHLYRPRRYGHTLHLSHIELDVLVCVLTRQLIELALGFFFCGSDDLNPLRVNHSHLSDRLRLESPFSEVNAAGSAVGKDHSRSARVRGQATFAIGNHEVEPALEDPEVLYELLVERRRLSIAWKTHVWRC
jgi:hypothetical protein